MEEYSNHHVSNLNGYLRCLSRLCGPEYAFGVNAYKTVLSIESFADEIVTQLNKDKSEYVYHGYSEIEYEVIRNKIKGYIFNGCINQEALNSLGALKYAERTLIDDINESYGLVSTSINKEGVFHPLITGPVYTLNISNTKNKKSIYYAVKIESIYVLTYFIIHHK